MVKRLVSVMLAILLVFAVSAVVFADDDAPIEGTPQNKAVIYFDAESVGWEQAKYVGFHIWELGGEPFNKWSAKAERGTLCKEYNEHGEEIDVPCFIWQFDFAEKGIILEEGKQYGVIFYNDNGGQTYNLLFDTACIGDVAYGDTSNLLENPEDSNRAAIPAYWTNQDPAVNGPELKISSIGNVVGSCIPRSQSTVTLLANFLTDTLENVHQFTEVTDQELIDHIGAQLKMTREDVEQALLIYDNANGPVAWTAGDSTLPGKHDTDDDEDDKPALRGDYDRDGEVNILDATRVQRIIAELVKDYSKAYCIRVDADNDGEMTILDATRIQRVIAELCDWDGNPPMEFDEYELPVMSV